MRLSWIAILAIGLSVIATARADGTTARHLLAGVRAFKAERYEEALVELRVVAHAPDAPADLAFYLGPTLVKLGRDREAIDVLVTSSVTPDALTSFYLGEAYYHLQMYRKAREVFGSLQSHGLGPVLDEAARHYVEAVDAVYPAPPAVATIDYYVDQAREAAADPVFASELLDEAHQVEALAATHHRHLEIVLALGAAWNTAGRSRATIELLGDERSLPADGTWQLARAYVAIHDGARARPLLAALVKAHAAHATEAAAMLATLPP